MGDSPAKKLNFESTGKENIPADIPAPIIDDLTVKKPITQVFDEKKTESTVVAPTIKSFEADEPLLKENPHRFVLFPIKYHEVRVYPHALRVKCFFSPIADASSTDRYGRCTRRLKPRSGPPKR